jgi:hypothetical protein
MTRYDDPPPEDWPALYRAGATLAEIARRTGFPPMYIRREMVARGVAIRPKGQRPKHPPGPIDPPLGYPVEPMDDYGPDYGAGY